MKFKVSISFLVLLISFLLTSTAIIAKIKNSPESTSGTKSSMGSDGPGV